MKNIILLSLSLLISYLSFSQSPIAEVLDYKENSELREGKLYSQYDYIIKINKKAGLKYAKVNIPSMQSGKKPIINAFIKDKNGEIIRKLKKRDLTKKSNISYYSLYEDDYTFEFSLLHYEFPYTLHYSYETEEEDYLRIIRWSPFYKYNLPIHKAELNLSVPKNTELNIKENNISPAIITEIAETKHYHWEAEGLKVIKSETYQASKKEIIPSVEVLPINFHYGTNGIAKSWKSFGQWYYNFTQNLDALPENEQKKVDAIIKDCKTDRDKIEKLYQFIQVETRYINVSIDLGGFLPYDASYVSKNKYGDCKALSNYFKAVLNYVGIKSHYALIYSDRKIVKTDTIVPYDYFNHMIVFIPLEGGNIWADCTSDLKCGYISSSVQNRYALIIEDQNSHLQKTPANEKEDVHVNRSFYLWQDSSNKAFIKVRNSYKGRDFEKLFYITNSIDEKDKLKILKDYFVENWMESPDRFIITTSEKKSEIILDYESASNTVFQKMNEEIFIDIPTFKLPYLKKPEKRKSPVQINYPIYYTDKIIFEIKNEETITDYPKSLEIKTEFGDYNIQCEKSDNQVIISKSFHLKAGTYDLIEYVKLYDFIKRSRKKENNLMVIFENK